MSYSPVMRLFALNATKSFGEHVASALGMALSPHEKREFEDGEQIRFGVDQARRGWLEADDVLNTRSWTGLNKLLKRR